MIPRIFAEGGAKGFYRGWWATFWRDVPSWGVYFTTYRFICDSLLPSWSELSEMGDDEGGEGENGSKDGYYFAVKLLAGGVAGWMNWIPAFPFDVIKSRI